MGKLKKILKTKTIDEKEPEKKSLIKSVRFKATQKTKESESVFKKLNKPLKSNETEEHKKQINQIKSDLIKNIAHSQLVKNVNKAPKSILKVGSTKNKTKNIQKQIKKKDKHKLKKAAWTEKIKSIKELCKDTIDKKKREKTVVVGDMKQLQETLNQINDESSTKKSKPTKESEKPKKKLFEKESKRNKELNDDISLFSQLLQYPQFTKNPLETLKKHFNEQNKK